MYPERFLLSLRLPMQHKVHTKSHYKGKNGPIHRCLLNDTANTELACEGSMDGHAHFWYRASSAIARPIIHGGRSLITYSLATAELELRTDEVPLPQVGQLFVPPAISNAICN